VTTVFLCHPVQEDLFMDIEQRIDPRHKIWSIIF